MAKYVGKIFRVTNKDLKIKGKGVHYVNVTWYNPVTHKFKCKIITSLEDKKALSNEEKYLLNIVPYNREGGNTYNLFARRKYAKLRIGEIEPIPVQKLKGFSVWSGYSGERDLSINVLKGKEQKHLKIEK